LSVYFSLGRIFSDVILQTFPHDGPLPSIEQVLFWFSYVLIEINEVYRFVTVITDG